MAVSRVDLKNGETLIDLTKDNVNEGSLVVGHTAHGADGEIIEGTNPYELEPTNAAVNTQTSLISQIKTALANKAAGGAGLPTQEKTVEITENGTVEVLPDEGYALSKVTAVVTVGSGGESDLPTGYSRVDYIQFTGEQIVDMKIVGNQNTSIQIVFTRERSTQHYLFGAASSDNKASITGYMGGSWRYGNKYASKNPITAADMIYSCTMDNSQVTITGSKTAISGVNDFETVGSLLLGACRNSDGTLGTSQFIGKILFAAAGQGGEFVRKLVPVTDGTVFRFWDAIGKKFHDSITDTPLEGGNL